MASSLRRRSRFRSRESERDPPAIDGSATEGESDSSSGDYEAELESMAGKGIKRLCSELLELKKESEQDFQRNLYSNHSAFLRIFEEMGSMQWELMELKQHVSTQKNLVQVLMDNLCSDIVSDHLPDNEDEESWYLKFCLTENLFGGQMGSVLEKLDVLLLEHRVEETLDVLETELGALQEVELEEDHASLSIVSYMSAVSERRTRLADWLASVAGHPRVAAAELQKAISGLCRLGESHRANRLLVEFYRSRLARNTHELDRGKPLLQGTHIEELANIVFSSISQAARSFVMLYGETSLYTSELIEWMREETETFGRSFNKYLKSISEASGVLSLAVKAVNTAFSYCSLLSSQKIVLRPDLVRLIRPSMEEVLQMHVDHYKKVVGILTVTDNWVLGKFLISGILRDKPSLKSIHSKLEYCLLTSSGRKFVTLMQAIIDDISSLVILQMESSILKGLADLFKEYVHTLERAIPHKVEALGDDYPRISSAQRLPQQISLLVSSCTLARLFPSIAASVFTGNGGTKNEILENSELSSHKEFDSWMTSIQRAADQLKVYFCQQFVHEIMSHKQQGIQGDSYTDGQCIPSSTEDLMPSPAIQVLFLRLRQLEEFSKSNLTSEDGMVEKLVIELLKGVIAWLSHKQEFWNDTEDCSLEQKRCYKQFHLDMHFLVEIARRGGYYSDDISDAALDLIEQLELAFTGIHSYQNSVVPDDEWVSTAAKLAIEKLLKVEVAKSALRVEPVVSFEEEASTQDDDYLLEADIIELHRRDEHMGSFRDEVNTESGEDANLFDVENALLISGDFLELRECQSEYSVGADNTELTKTRSVESDSLEGHELDERTTNYDGEGCRDPSIPFVDMNDGRNALEAEADSLSEMEGKEEVDAAGPVSIPENDFTVKLGKSHCIAEIENPLENKLLDGSDKLDITTSYINNSNETVDALEDCNELRSSDACICAEVRRSLLDSPVEWARICDKEIPLMLECHNTGDSINLSHSPFTTTMETMKDDWPRLKDATTEVRDYEIEEELPAESTELDLKSTSDKQGRDGINPVRDGKNSSSYSVQLKGGGERPKDVSAGELLGNNGKPMRTSRPRWH